MRDCSLILSIICEQVGVIVVRSAARGPRFYDGLAERSDHGLFGLRNYFSFAEVPVAHARSAVRNERTGSFPNRYSLIISEFGKNVCNANR